MEFLGLLLPVLIDLVNRKVADSDVKFWISVGFCVVVGAGFNWLQTQFSFGTPMLAFDSVTKTIMMVFGLAQLSYNGLWKDMSVREKMGLKGN